MEKLTPGLQRMMEAIQRSGYIMESELIEILSESGYVVEPNQAIVDKITGKSREFDLLASIYNETVVHGKPANPCISLVIEVKNNSAPIVLMTPQEWGIRMFGSEHLKQCNSTGINFQDIEDEIDPISQVLLDVKIGVYTQYCSFQEKKFTPPKQHGKPTPEVKELMAFHPDDMHESFLKITQYIEQSINQFDFARQHGQRHRFKVYIPVLYISDSLYVMDSNLDGDFKLKPVKRAILCVNYYHNNESKCAYVQVVTKAGLSNFTRSINTLYNSIASHLKQHRKKP